MQLIELICTVRWARILIISRIRSISVPFHPALSGSAGSVSIFGLV